MTNEQILELTNGDRTAARLLVYLCQRHHQCVVHLPADARASIARPYTGQQLWLALDGTASLDSIGKAIALLVHKGFVGLYDNVDGTSGQWYEVFLPRIKAAIDYITTTHPRNPMLVTNAPMSYFLVSAAGVWGRLDPLSANRLITSGTLLYSVEQYIQHSIAGNKNDQPSHKY
jgi:hypothetical protein